MLHRTRQEVPHAVEVQVDEIIERDDLVEVHALLWVETESQKGILIGRRGVMIKAIGTAARRELEQAVGMRVHLDLSVRVRAVVARRRRAARPARDQLAQLVVSPQQPLAAASVGTPNTPRA